jgi:translation initiation factor 1
MPAERSRLIYSTDQATPLSGSHQGKKVPDKVLKASMPSAQERVTVRLDRKNRGGKSVTVIEGLRMPQVDRVALLKQLKAGLGTGGTVKGTSLEIQGDHRDALMAALENMGYRPKRSGG